MTHRTSLIVVALTASTLVSGYTAMASDKPPIVLTPSSQWVVDYDDDRCIVARAFGTDAQRIVARLTWFEPSDGFQLMLIGKPVPSGGTSSRISIDFGPKADPHTVRSMDGSSGDLPMTIVTNVRLDDYLKDTDAAEPPPIGAEQEQAAEWLDIRMNSGKSWRLATGSMKSVMAAKRTCTRDLVKHWGFDPAVQETLSRKAKAIGSPGTWLTSEDYPASALTQGASGLVRFRLDIDPHGGVGGCHVLKGVHSPEFEKLTCTLIRRRARLLPALDATGRPIASYYVNTVAWKMAGS